MSDFGDEFPPWPPNDPSGWWNAAAPHCGVARFHILLEDGHDNVFGYFETVDLNLDVTGLPLVELGRLGWCRRSQLTKALDPGCL